MSAEAFTLSHYLMEDPIPWPLPSDDFPPDGLVGLLTVLASPDMSCYDKKVLNAACWSDYHTQGLYVMINQGTTLCEIVTAGDFRFQWANGASKVTYFNPSESAEGQAALKYDLSSAVPGQNPFILKKMACLQYLKRHPWAPIESYWKEYKNRIVYVAEKQPLVCDVCCKRANHKCAICLSVFYCDAECQASDFTGHRLHCDRIAKLDQQENKTQ